MPVTPVESETVCPSPALGELKKGVTFGRDCCKGKAPFNDFNSSVKLALFSLIYVKEILMQKS